MQKIRSFFKLSIVLFTILVLIFSACSTQKTLYRYDFAPIQLAYVDFKIPRGRTVNYWGDKIGNYNFKLFGCTRRDSKDVVLDTGRVMQHNMRFFNSFFEGLNDYYNVVVDFKNPYFIYSNTHLQAEYLVIAEITNLFLNVCDHYDWRTRDYKNLRSGSGEIEVVWKITDLTRRNIFWQSTSNGYASIDDPIINGETRLVEKAFADALERMRHLPGFKETIAKRRLKNHLLAERKLLADLDMKYIKTYDEIRLELEQKFDDNLKPKDAPIDDVAIGKLGDLGDASPRIIGALKLDDNDNWLDITADDLAQKGFKSEDGWIGDSNYSDIITIKKQPAFDEMTPYVMYRIRTGVVSVKNENNDIASGLLISPEIILTSDNVAHKNLLPAISTINDYNYNAKTFRRNPLREVALLAQETTEFYPLPLRLNLPEIGEEVFFALGAPTYEAGEGFLDDKGIVTGYRYTEGGAMIMTDTYVQEKTLGGALIDKFGNILGMAKGGIRLLPDDKDFFIPITDALEKLGVVIAE